MTITTQLRRYQLHPELVAEFLEWWPNELVPARTAAGFTIEFGVHVPETNEFVWAVSVPGDRAEFEAVQDAWMSSPARDAVFEGRPKWFSEAIIHYVDDFSPRG